MKLTQRQSIPAIIDLPSNADERGVLTSVEEFNDIPFDIKRVFYMHGMVQDRGGHGHMDTEQLVSVVSGSMTFQLTSEDGTKTKFYLDDPCKGLYIPQLTFIEIQSISLGAVCLVLANTHYDMSKSLRNREDFDAYIEQRRSSNL